jgi:hypothetical protein
MEARVEWFRCMSYESAADYTGAVYLHERRGKPYYWGKLKRTKFGGASKGKDQPNPRYALGYRHWVNGALTGDGKLFIGTVEPVEAIDDVESSLIATHPTEMNRRVNEAPRSISVVHLGDVPPYLHDSVDRQVESVSGFLEYVEQVIDNWKAENSPWFRGEPISSQPLIPKLHRQVDGGRVHSENQLLQWFRNRAPVLDTRYSPERGNTVDWLFLMQHVGLATRLLDWTEGALVALFFSLLAAGRSMVWILEPIRLNKLSTNGYDVEVDTFPLPWYPGPENENVGNRNFRAAWEQGKGATSLPVAVMPTNIHPRMAAQRSCFTIWGSDSRSLVEIVDSSLLFGIPITGDPARRTRMRQELRRAGIDYSSLFPDLDGLARELNARF